MSNVWDDWAYEDYLIRAYQANKESKHKLYNPEEFWAYINQDKIWITADRRELKIKDITKDHLFNILLWANRHYSELLFVFDTAKQLGKIPDDLWFSTPVEYPLFNKIQKRYLKLAQKDN